MKYITLAEFGQTLGEKEREFFLDKWTRIVNETPRRHSFHNTLVEWQKLYVKVERCDMMCTYGCNNTTKPNPVGPPQRCGCFLMAGHQ